MNQKTSEGREPLRVFVVATDAEWITDDLLDEEIASIRKAMDRGDGGAVFQSLSTLDPTAFISVAKEFRPDVIHFTRRGSVIPYLRMSDQSGWIRKITGTTLARYITAIGHKVKYLFFENCTVWRHAEHLAAVSSVVAAWSKSLTFELPARFVEAFYFGLQLQHGFAKTIHQLDLSLSNSLASGEVLFKAYEQNDSQAETPKFLRKGIQIDQDEMRMTADDSLVYSLAIEALSKPLDNFGLIDKDDGPREYRVWFGTNRKPLDEASLEKGFSSERSDRVYYGSCDISIPKYHTIGSLGDPWWKRFPLFWRNNRLAIQSRYGLSVGEFWKELHGLFLQLPSDDKTLLIFLHGYNVSFDAAALRAAQLGFDLGIRGTTVFFSWPSKGKVRGYPADIASLEASEQQIGTFICDMAEKSGANKVHIIAHSMGNRGLLRAFSNMFSAVQDKVAKPFGQIFLAAPDVDVDLFKRMAAVYQKVAQRTTMYVSQKDMALRSSGLLHDYPRAGYTPPITVVEGIDTIEVSNIDLTYLGHGYVAEARPILTDMHSLIEKDAPPDRRFGMEEKLLLPSMKYWRVRP